MANSRAKDNFFMRVLFCLLLFLMAAPTPAQMFGDDFGPVAAAAHLRDRHGKPVSGVRLRVTLDGDGLARDAFGETRRVQFHETKWAVTDAGGTAAVSLTRPPLSPKRWFQGRLRVSAEADEPLRPDDPTRPLTFLSGRMAEAASLTVPAAPGGDTDGPTLTIFEMPDCVIGGFPVWTGGDPKLTKIVVVLEGFDLYNEISATDAMRLLAPAGDAVRARGLSVLVVNFPDAHQTPDALAPLAARAVRAASQASGHKVSLVGLSAGGVIARWALVQAENEGRPLPVNTFVSVDSPHRGGTFDSGLQAMTLRFGTPEDKAALDSPAARALLVSRPADIRWRYAGLPLAGHFVPARWTEDTSAHDAFYDKLRHLNANGGWPRGPRRVAVASGARTGASGTGGLLHLWIPANSYWTLPALPADHAPGSLLPPQFVARFNSILPFGLGGAYLRSAPTFIATSSALDAGPDETPPFDAFWARPAGRPAIAHDAVDPDEAAFVVQELLRADWSANGEKRE